MAAPAILYVHDLRGSGVVTNAIALARRLGAERETILCAGFGKGLNADVDVSPARLVTLDPGDGLRFPRFAAAKGLRELIRSSGAGVVMSMGNFGHRSVLGATAGLEVRTVYRISNEVGRSKAGRLKNIQRRAWHRLLLARGDRAVLVGRALADQPLFAAAIARGRAAFIPNGVDVERARRDAKAPAPHPWLDDDGPPVVLSIGRIHPQKNLGGLIDAAALAMTLCPLRLIIVGSGNPILLEMLKSRASEAGIGHAVLFAGETDNVFAWLARARLFALPSHWEGSSTALLEALAVGTPALASRQAGDAAHVLNDGEYGVLVDADDPASIAEGIVRQLVNPVLPGERVEAYRLERTHQRYLDLLRSL
jgi:glycosyltransferase involved in cell wall biosynthesis